MARDFPLDRVVISPSGLLGFSGQRGPIKLGGEVNSNFVPASSGGGGSSSAASPPPKPARIINLYSFPHEKTPFGLVYLRDRAIDGARLAVADYTSSGTLLSLNGISAGEPGTFGITGLGTSIGVTQARNASGTLYVGTEGEQGLRFFEPDGGATGIIALTGTFPAIAADSDRLYTVHFPRHRMCVGCTTPTARRAAWCKRAASTGVSTWALSMAVFDPRVDGVATTPIGTTTIFVGTEGGAIFSAEHEGASRTLATGLGQVTGLAFATPTLYAAISNPSKVIALNVNNPEASRVVVTAADANSVTGGSSFYPWGLALDSTAVPTYLYVSDLDSKKILRVEPGDL
jgi:hypothetical protein